MISQLWNRIQARYNPEAYIRRIGVRLGQGSRLGTITLATFGSEPYLITIGDRVNIANDVRFITHDGGVTLFRDEIPDLDVIRPIFIGNDVFFGIRAIVLPGTIIGNRVLVGAGAVVHGTIPDGSVVVSVPARRVCSMDDYRAKCLKDGLRTKGMGEQEKRRFLESHFYANDKSGSRP